ncbi:MAG TPA: hypothetical protein VM937_07910 [Burkholderiaceae bacterium]|nr:hypothetical protein [Burkholderiaceae bacterium]
MRIDVRLQQAKPSDRKRQDHFWRAVRAAIGSLAVGGAGLIFGFAMDLHDARWAGAWIVAADAASPLSAANVRGVVAANKHRG